MLVAKKNLFDEGTGGVKARIPRVLLILVVYERDTVKRSELNFQQHRARIPLVAIRTTSIKRQVCAARTDQAAASQHVLKAETVNGSGHGSREPSRKWPVCRRCNETTMTPRLPTTMHLYRPSHRCPLLQNPPGVQPYHPL